MTMRKPQYDIEQRFSIPDGYPLVPVAPPASPSLETESTETRAGRPQVSWRREIIGTLKVGGAFMVGAVALAIAVDVVASLRTGTKESSRAEVPTTPTTIAPSIPSSMAQSGGESCDVDTKTVKSGDSVYALSTQGFSGESEFSNDTYRWNYNNLVSQGMDPNKLSVGQKISILDGCILYGENFNFGSTPFRRIEYQDYEGTDNRVHHDVQVNYDSSANGAPVRVEMCYPDPACYTYVAGAPSAPPQGF